MYFLDYLCIDSYSFNEGVITVNRKLNIRLKKPKLNQNQMKHTHITFFGLISIHVSEAYKLESFLL